MTGDGSSGPRIVSLLASGTEIACELGLEDRLVGISHECDHPPSVLDRPRVSRPRFDPAGLSSGEVDRAVRRAMAEHGSVYEVDGDLLGRLRPDLVLTQAVCEVCAVPTPGVRRLLEERNLRSRVVSLDAHTLEEIFASVRQVAGAARVAERGEVVAERLRGRIDRAAKRVAGAPRPGVLAVEWLDPLFVPGHWVPEMIERAGGRVLAGRAAEPSRVATREELERLDPDVLLVMPCGYGLDAAVLDAEAHAETLVSLAPRAVAAGRTWVLDGSAYFNRSGPRVARGVEILAAVLHPSLAGPAPADAARRWAPRRAEAPGG